MIGRLRFFACLIIAICIFLSSCSSPPSPKTSPLPKKSTATSLSFSPLSQWQERVFAGKTQYILLDNNTLKASSNASASMLYRQIKIDLHKTPYLNWQWKVEQTLPNIDEKTRQGDDFPARIYIAITPRPFSFYPRALNYVWANHSPALSSWASPYSQDAIVIALESGNQNAGQWVTAKRNLREDIKRYFGEDIQFIEGVAVMTDADNSQQSATGYYRSLFFSAE